MKPSTKKIKEEGMMDAAEQVFFSVGFANAKMEDIAKVANCSKSTLYTYFESKENLYMAITHRAFQALLDGYYEILAHCFEQSGFERSSAIFKYYLAFSETHFNYYQLLLEYLTFIRSVSDGQGNKLTEPLKRSFWFRKVQDFHNTPLILVAQHIKDGQKDGSILNKQQPQEIFLTIWALIIGFTKLAFTAPETKRTTLYQVNLKDWKHRIFGLIETILLN